jgi:hypothetical protein
MGELGVGSQYRIMKKIIHSIIIFVFTGVVIYSNLGCGESKSPLASTVIVDVQTEDPLPSWNDGEVKKAIISYVRAVTDPESPEFIPIPDRIATFDNDGTLWAERPFVQELFAFYRVRKMIDKDPSLANKQPFKAVLEKDKEYFLKGGEKVLLEVLLATNTGLTEDEFETTVREFFTTVRYPKYNVTIEKITYQPQVELLGYLRMNGFKTFICTGGTVEFVRGISQQLYGIPEEQVIGTTFKYKFVDSSMDLLREADFTLFNDKEGKPVGIQERIGRRPVFACGNEGGAGDIAMLRFSQGSRYRSFQMLINHDDSTREFYYQEKDNASLNAAAKNNWKVVSMKNDWKTVFMNE